MLANELLAELVQRSLPLPDEVVIDVAPFYQQERNVADIPALSKEGRLVINPDAVIWTNPEAFARILKKQRFWSSGHLLHALRHEAGYIVHYKADPDRYAAWVKTDLTPRQKTLIAGEVSSRAQLNIYEFVAEVFAGRLAEETYSRRILNLYRKYGGIEP